jgi:hypothetical protein
VKQALSSLRSREAKRGISALLLGMLLLLQAMVALPALHQLIHYDAASSAHQCAVTMLAHGQIDCATTDVRACGLNLVLMPGARLPDVHFVSTDLQLQPSRGPPQGSVLLG